ncbi:MAG: helix-turn-helix transcriptional regulator [Candidatus Eremiobacteraeota bacterium]|nr:helix-turn-helix transcriptional regulator [Candidatus Eremiobacteraeota bacterium]MBC5801443.1 helix-turn-helix transcriptional regulator [Candidatus Eremiobacteraeota bacterium]MBC5823208.1 helix-turn-helix transcriptional regulator [Candidatus Eremiobacteraeota bacterium]
MPIRSYGQYCGLARALEVVGERWALLIVRDLLVGPRRFSDLQRGLPNIPSNILTARLKEFEGDGVVQRRVQPRPLGGVAYELTESGRELADAIIALGRWGAKRLGDPGPGEVLTADSLAIALRSLFHSEAAHGDDLAYELRVGEIVLNAHVRDGAVEVGKGHLAHTDLVIEAGPAIRSLLAREITPNEALKRGVVRIRGKRPLLERFVQTFYI